MRALERLIEDNPYDPDAYAVYADFLQRAGDPRGELIALDLAAKSTTKFFAKHAARLAGAVARRESRALEWRFGFIHAVELGMASLGERLQLLKEVLAHPSGRFIVNVALVAYEPRDLKKQIAALLKRPPPTLRGLRVFCSETLGDLQPLVDAFPRLERLDLCSDNFALPKPASDLVELRCVGQPLRKNVMTTIAGSPWPRLQRLDLGFGDPDADYYGKPKPGTVATLDDLLPLLARSDLPALTQLSVTDCVFADAVASALVTSPLRDQLEVVEIDRR